MTTSPCELSRMIRPGDPDALTTTTETAMDTSPTEPGAEPTKCTLFSFVGSSDLSAAGLATRAPEPGDPGPISRLLTSGQGPWQCIVLVDDRGDSARMGRFTDWLQQRHGPLPLVVSPQPLANPAALEQAVAAARAAIASRPGAGERAYLTTPGTAAMAMAWMYLSQQSATRGRLLTTHRDQPPEWLKVAPAAAAGRCVILRGIPGAGKSKAAGALAASAGLPREACVFSTDDRFDEFNGGMFDPALLPRMHQLNLAACIQAMHAGRPLVVCDNTNVEAWEFAAYVAAALALGYTVDEQVIGRIWDDDWVAGRARDNPRAVPPERVLDMAGRLRASLSG